MNLSVMKDKEGVLYSVLLGAVMVLALALRLHGIEWGLPSALHPNYSYHPDEAFTLIWARWLVEGHVIPKHFIYGGTFYYSILNAFIVFGQWFSEALGGINLLANSILFGRYFLTFIALVSVLLLYECGRVLFDRPTGLIAALLLAVTPAHVMSAQHVRPEEVGVMLVLAALYLAARTLKTGPISVGRAFSCAGALAGISFAFRFSLVVFAALPFLALFLRLRCGATTREAFGVFTRKSGIAVAAALAAYVITSPYTLVYFQQMKEGIMVTYQYESSVFLDAFDNGPLVFQHLGVALPQALGYGEYLLALAGLGYALKKRSKADIVILAGGALYAVLLVSASWVVVRYTLPLAPLLLVLAARMVVEVVRGAHRPAFKFVAGSAATAAVLWSVFSTIAFLRVEASQNVRDVAAEWIESNLPSGSTILLLQSYPGDVFFNPVLSDRHRVEQFVLTEDSDSARLFCERKYDYIVLHEPVYRNMERLGARHPLKQSRIFYESLKEKGYEIQQEFKSPVRFAGMDFSGSFTTLDYLPANPGIRVYRRRG